jgi:hypothetical protein
MKITHSSLRLEADHQQMQFREVTESIRMRANQRPQESASGGAGESKAAYERVSISEGGRIAQSMEDFRLAVVRLLLARLFGREVEVLDKGRQATGAPAANAGENMSFEYNRHESYTEAERTNFSASGVIQTADGQTIGFDFSMSMERYYHAESDLNIRLGSARQTCDPLVINFSGNAAELADQRFAFDLNADGDAAEQINFLGSGSGFLAFDRNGDGAINDGSELFGARSGNGFLELAALDADGNGWIDESDAAFAFLSIWIKNDSGEILRSLKDTGIGAIGLASAASPFSIKDGNNDLQGQVRASGVYLWEDGRAGSIQQVDLTV